MSLAPYLVTSLSRNDITESPKDRNIVIGAIVEFRQGGVPQTIYDDAIGSNPATQKVTDSNGQLNAWVEVGDYELSVNGVVKNISVNKNLLPNDINGVVERVGDLSYSIREIETDQSAPGSASNKLMTAKQINSIIDATASDLESAIATPKPILSIPFGINQTEEFLNGSVSCVRSTVKNYVDIYGAVREAPANTLAIEKDGALIEGASTNLILQSQSIGLSPWTARNGAVVTDNFSDAPNLTNTSSQIDLTSQAVSRVNQSVSVTAGVEYTFSVWVRSDTPQTIYLSLNQPVPDEVSFTVGNEWQRVSITQVAGASTLFPQIGSSFNQEGVFEVWGAQFEQSNFATSYILTTSSPATRAADVVTIPALNNYLGQNEGAHTIYIKTSTLMQRSRILNAKSTIGQNGKYYFQIDNERGEFSNGSTTTTNTASATVSNLNSYALTFNGVKSLAYVNGVSGDDGLSPADSELDTASPLTIGSRDSGAGDNMYGHVKDLKVFNVSLSATQIKGLG